MPLMPKTPRLQPVTDSASVATISDLLDDQFGDEVIPVSSMVPGGHEAYARILHPAREYDGEVERKVRWSEIASGTGAPLLAETPFRRITVPPGAPVPLGPQGAWDEQGWPNDGTLPEKECLILLNLLEPFTSTGCWFLLWDGWSGLRLDDDQVTVTWHRNPHLVFRGPLETAASFNWSGPWQSPHMWFPEDRSWCVGTEIDGDSTFLAGPERFVTRLLENQDMESIRTKADAVAIRVGEWLTP
jgi:hypothetical protein